MLKVQFDIQRVYSNGSQFHYEVFYRHDNRYVKACDTHFLSIVEARQYIEHVVSEVYNDNRI
jgi:hypothetical protein